MKREFSVNSAFPISLFLSLSYSNFYRLINKDKRQTLDNLHEPGGEENYSLT